MIKQLWRKFTLVILFVWCVVLILIGARFAQNNPDLISLDLILWQLPPLSSGLLLTISLLFGVLLGAVMFLPVLLVMRARVRRLRTELLKLQQSPRAPVGHLAVNQ
ncbi:MAG: LapA family protein [Cellvibrionaceae bacterium]|nr:LapA family protein [Cellvibrionaceae bacterium]